MVFKAFKLKRLLIVVFTIIFLVFLLVIVSKFVVAKDNEYIKWIDFSPTYEILEKTSSLDIKSHNEDYPVKYNWIELLAYLSSKYYGDLKIFKQVDLTNLIANLNSGISMQELSKDMKYYPYYLESYSAILGGFIGEYEIEIADNVYEKKYGLKVFCPIAKGHSFRHYEDFGSSRSYGYKREHLGNDLMGSIGTPIIAVESGYIEALGWNQYGGWRIGIRSFDGKRYYYYAHLRKDHPYSSDICEGAIVKAGDVVGYLGMTGYSSKENVNNINVPHLHFGLQLIFDESQKDGVNQIWINVFDIVNFLKKNSSEVIYDSTSKEYSRKFDFMESSVAE